MISCEGSSKGCFFFALLPLLRSCFAFYDEGYPGPHLSLVLHIALCIFPGTAAALSAPVAALGNALDIPGIAFGSLLPALSAFPRIAAGIPFDIVAAPVALVLAFRTSLGILAVASVAPRIVSRTFFGIVAVA